MKKFAVIFLLLSFSAKPVYELGYLGYFELNINYIIEKYCINKDKPEMQCNGQCHLMKQLSLADAPMKEGSNTIHLIEAFYPVFFQEYQYADEYLHYFVAKQDNFGELKMAYTFSLNVAVPPPKV